MQKCHFSSYKVSCSCLQGAFATSVWTLNAETSSCRTAESALSPTACRVGGRRLSSQPSPPWWTSSRCPREPTSPMQPSCSACCASPSQRVPVCATWLLCSCRTAAARSSGHRPSSRSMASRQRLESHCPKTEFYLTSATGKGFWK